ncbi:hypothetical protein AAF712_014850 [Marasmius tenuissimus]|uniref:DNA 3'-5' helicase n=1 Tax=Marasmius tenuissimus TaxID=585030 RepID=A0ABR2ZBT6_9AGAR
MLMESQMQDLASRGIPAVALNSKRGNLCEEDLFMKQGRSRKFKYCVITVSPEKALSKPFQELVLNNDEFKNNCIQVVVDEAHCISEWGDDFCPEYSELGKLLACLPSTVPVLAASATMPPGVMQVIRTKLGIALTAPHIAVSNEKNNVSLSVRILQHPQDTYADLLDLFPLDATSPSNFPQTLIYVNSRQEAEEIQDFLRQCHPDCIPAMAFKFYHRSVHESQKVIIQDALRDGTLCGVSATNALGMGMDFHGIMRVLLWHAPPTFLSLIQKIGCCVRNPNEFGEIVIFLTCTAWLRHLSNFESFEEGQAELREDDEPKTEAPPVPEGAQIDRIAAMDVEEPLPEGENVLQPTTNMRGKRRAALSQIEERDWHFLTYFIATSKC